MWQEGKHEDKDENEDEDENEDLTNKQIMQLHLSHLL